ncbi:MAG TPA: hypothetical protein VH475_03895 [Tepidisphaeraceae bacterium]|jgi:hypothetical protein
MTEDLIEQPIDYRTRALLWAAGNCASVVRDLLAWHPDAARLRQRAADGDGDGQSLAALLWQELADTERWALGASAGPQDLEPAGGTPTAYWLRRKRAARWRRWRAAADRLPRMWLKLLEMPAAAVRVVYMGVGLDMTVCGITGQSSEKLIRFLAPLGNDLACQAATRLREPQYWHVSDAVCQRWREACSRAMKLVSGEKVVSTLGRGLLAALYRRLPESDRREAAQLSRSSLPSLLEEDVFLEPVTADELKAGEQMFNARLAATNGKGGHGAAGELEVGP